MGGADKIAEVYALADKLSRDTGVPHDVDHIMPIAGRNVCGLHVHNNLRAIPASENRKKSYKFDLHLAQEDMRKQIETLNRRGYRLVLAEGK